MMRKSLSTNKKVQITADQGETWHDVPYSDPTLQPDSSVGSEIKIFEPPKRLGFVFCSPSTGEELGRLYESEEDGKLYFSGDPDESAKTFFRAVCGLWNDPNSQNPS